MSESDQSKVVWDIESTNPELIEPLREELKKVRDPELGLNVLELGLVRNVFVTKDEATLMMIMTTPFCPYAPALLEITRQKAEVALKRSTSVTLGFEPWDPSMMEENARAEWGFF
jgi:metal-sulfur cluster biosynthetic enzyme